MPLLNCGNYVTAYGGGRRQYLPIICLLDVR